MKKSNLKIAIVLIVIALVCFGGYFLINKDTGDNDSNNNQNNGSNTNHSSEFSINEGKYLETNYDRYVAYKNVHPDYSDDQIITYVNIGLDREFYSETLKSNEKDGKLIIANKYFWNVRFF